MQATALLPLPTPNARSLAGHSRIETRAEMGIEWWLRKRTCCAHACDAKMPAARNQQILGPARLPGPETFHRGEEVSMLRTKRRLAFHLAALATLLLAAASPAAAQLAKTKKMEAASGAQSSGGSVPLRVGLVISDAVRSYKTMVFLTRIEFGRRLAEKAEKIFGDTFASVQPMKDVPADPRAAEGLDLIVIIDAPDGRTQTGLFSSNTISLTARFTARTAKGEQFLQVQETDNEKFSSPSQGPDQVGETVVRKFIQELILSPTVRNLLAPAPAAPVAAQAQPVRDDSAALASAGLDVPPPPPWAKPGSERRP